MMISSGWVQAKGVEWGGRVNHPGNRVVHAGHPSSHRRVHRGRSEHVRQNPVHLISPLLLEVHDVHHRILLR